MKEQNEIQGRRRSVKNTSESERKPEELTVELSHVNRRLQRATIERETAEEALRESEVRLKDFADVAADWLWEVDGNQRYIHLDARNEEALGVGADAFLGRTRRELFAHQISEEPDVWERHFKDVEARRPFRDFEFVWYRPDGRALVIQTSGKPVFDKHGLLTGYRGASRDITERRWAERAVEKSRARFEDFAGTAADWLWETDNDLRLTYVSGRAEEVMGVPLSQLVGKQYSKMLVQVIHDDPDVWQRHLGDLQAQRPFKDFELTWRRPDGATRVILSSGKPILDSDGNYQGYRGAARDITEHVRAEQNARRHLDDLAHASRLAVMGEMVGGIAHELNQPLSSIIGFAEAALRMVKADNIKKDVLVEALTETVASGERAGEIVRRLRQFVAKGELERAPINVNNVVRAVLKRVGQDVLVERIKVQLELDEAAPQVFADEIQIEQVVLNLVRNAIDAMTSTEPRARELTIRTHIAATNRSGVELVVSDTGAGLPANNPQRVFETFFTTKPDGMGMGLAISRSIIEAHGGQLQAGSNSQRGAVFRFNLPAIELSAL